MNKYKDFYNLKDRSEPEKFSLKTALIGLFYHRYYSEQLNSPLADNIIILKDGIWNEPFTHPDNKISTLEERIELKNKSEFGAFRFPDDANETKLSRFANIEINRLKLEEIADEYLYSLIEAYLKICEQIIKSNKSKFSLQEFALIAVYENKLIATNKRKLYQWFTYYTKRDHRIDIDETKLKTLNKLARIEKIIPYLSKSAQKIATDELNILKSAITKDY